MTAGSPDLPSELSGSFEYYMLRVSRSGHRADHLAGQVEHLGTGEKLRFESAEQLIRLFLDERTPR